MGAFQPDTVDSRALREELGLGLPADPAEAVPEVCAQGRSVVAVVEVAVATVRELARESDPDEGGAELLTDAALGPGVESLDPELPGLVQFLHAPTSMMEIRDRWDGIGAVVEQGGREAGFRVPVPVLDDPDAEGPAATRGLVPGRVEGDGPVAHAGGEEGVEYGVSAVRDAEPEVPFALLVDQGEGAGAAVGDDDVAFGGVAEVCKAARSFSGSEPVEVDRDAVGKPIEYAGPALGVVGTVDDAVAVLREFPGQGNDIRISFSGIRIRYLLTPPY